MRPKYLNGPVVAWDLGRESELPNECYLIIWLEIRDLRFEIWDGAAFAEQRAEELRKEAMWKDAGVSGVELPLFLLLSSLSPLSLEPWAPRQFLSFFLPFSSDRPQQRLQYLLPSDRSLQVSSLPLLCFPFNCSYQNLASYCASRTSFLLFTSTFLVKT